MIKDGDNSDLDQEALTAFRACSFALGEGRLAFELRPRPRDVETAFSGDYDYLMDASRFAEIVQMFFVVCLEHAVSFQVRHRAAFKRQIILFGGSDREITVEFWPHAELATGDDRDDWSYLLFGSFVEACERGLKEEILALVFLCHLHFKNKDLSDPQNQWRLEEFAGRMSKIVQEGRDHAVLAGKIRGLLTGVREGSLSLEGANREAIGLLREEKIQLEDREVAKRQRWQRKAGRIFRGWGARIVPCVGPDGSGKTHFIDSVMGLAEEKELDVASIRFKHLFRKNFIYGRINKRYRVRHDLPKNTADERLAPLLYWAAMPLYWWNILRSLGRDAVFMDRFFLEFMVQGYREDGDQGLREMPGYSLLSRLIPEPRRMVVLAADNELITSRKAELSAEAIQDFYRRYVDYSVEARVSIVLFLNSHRSGSELAGMCLGSLGLRGGSR